MFKKELKKKHLLKCIKANQYDSLSSFIQKAFFTVNPNTEYIHNWHIDLIAEYLKACEKGEITRLIINIPPRSLKSMCVSVAWPAWLLGHDPSSRIISSSYSQILSLKHSTDCRLVLTSDWYKNLFPEVILAHDQNEKSKFTTTKRGCRIATSVGGTITGEGGNYLIVDDPHNPAHVGSETMRKSTLEWFDKTFSTRLDDKKKGVFVIVMQRLHADDLTGHLLAKGTWDHLCLPSIAEKKIIIDFGGISKIRNIGDILHPAREGKVEIENVKLDLGTYGFSAQYQQAPVPESGGMIKYEWLKRYTVIPSFFERIIQSWDTAIKSGKHNDYSVCTTWYETKTEYYLVDVKRRRMEYPELKHVVINFAEKWNPDVILIEDKASGQSLLQDLKRETKLPIVAINPVNDKITRMAAVSAIIEAGNVFLPESSSWLMDYETELMSFPSVAHDDQVDSTSQFLNWVRSRKRQVNIRMI